MIKLFIKLTKNSHFFFLDNRIFYKRTATAIFNVNSISNIISLYS